MKSFLLRSCLVLFLTILASGAFFEWVLLRIVQHGEGSGSLDRAFLISLLFDVVLVAVGALALSWPTYRRLKRLGAVVQMQQAGTVEARARFRGSDAIAELAHAFDALADLNASQLENQRALLRAVSHELRTPVARLRFAVEAFERAPQEAKAELRERVDRDLDELNELIEEILAYSKVAPGGAPREIESFDLREVLEEVANEHPNFSIEVHAPPALCLKGEPRLIRRAISNLVRNAVFHGRSVVRIHVEIGDTVDIRIEDDGEGLPSQADERLFLPFVRYGKSGVGLGSSIALAIAQRHGGSLSFRPRPPGSGAEFVMQLPLSTEGQDSRSP